MFDHVDFGRDMGSMITDMSPRRQVSSVITDMSNIRRGMGSALTDLWVRPMTDLGLEQRGPDVSKRISGVGDPDLSTLTVGVVLGGAVFSLLSGVLFAIGFSFGSSIRNVRTKAG